MMFDEDKIGDIIDEADLNGNGEIDVNERWDFFDLLEEEIDAAGRRSSSSARSSLRSNKTYDDYSDVTERGRFSSAKSSYPDDDDDDDYDDYDEDEDEEEIELDRDGSLDAKLLKYRTKIDEIIKELQQILDEEERFVEEGSDKYGDTDRYEQAEENVNYLDDAISDLEDASFCIEMAAI